MKKIFLFNFFVFFLLISVISCSDEQNKTDYVPGLSLSDNSSAGAVIDGKKILAYQLIGFVENNSSIAKEKITLRVDWKNSSGQILMTDKYYIPRIEPKNKWPIWIYHNKAEDVSILNSFTEYNISFESWSDNTNFYTSYFLFKDLNVSYIGDCTRVTGKLINRNSYPVKNLVIEAASISQSGKCVEYGLEILNGEILQPGQSTTFNCSFCLPIGTPDSTFFFCSGINAN